MEESWIRTDKRTTLQKLACSILKRGPIPKHVAFIMDGNRRYANRRNLDRAQGHLLGFDKLTETLEWCLDLGIREVTVYAFSIENFKRSQDEVDCLMELAKRKFTLLLAEKEKLAEYGVCVRIIGNISLLPPDLQQIVADVAATTMTNSRSFLNVCIAYTSREEMSHAVKEVAVLCENGTIDPANVTEKTIASHLYTKASPDPELLIRTSGEVRLSDFLLWQVMVILVLCPVRSS
ncbi:hypothetical protein RvY_09273-1 [Ramazzottius varieornatus]|uniref:Alkyl transferase n=1 Tax=Ramazzottius varieornatus TaxID=947166 RepID=A0A1D1VHW8_RAMVA|nr:hypothetical protein RvY_09273-1 [Ramazzottius varieornatus]